MVIVCFARNLACVCDLDEAHMFNLKLKGSIEQAIQCHSIGQMTMKCQSCFALHWPREKVKKDPLYKLSFWYVL